MQNHRCAQDIDTHIDTYIKTHTHTHTRTWRGLCARKVEIDSQTAAAAGITTSSCRSTAVARYNTRHAQQRDSQPLSREWLAQAQCECTPPERQCHCAYACCEQRSLQLGRQVGITVWRRCLRQMNDAVQCSKA